MPQHPPLKTFIIYARLDEAHKQQLVLHLRPLINSRLLSVWHDGNILPGEDWEKAIKQELQRSDLVLVLVSANSLNSHFIQTEELRTALDRLRDGLTRVVPIIVSPCVWKFDPALAGLQALPRYENHGPKPVTDRVWQSTDEAWSNAVEHIGEMVLELNAKRGAAAEPQENKSADQLPQPAAAAADLAAEAQRAKEAAQKTKEALALEALRANDPFHDLMVPIKGGTFNMGDTFGDGGPAELPVHPVTVPDFLLCKYPVTQAQWRRVMGTDPSRFKGDNLPVEQVSWDDVQDFLKKLNQRTGLKYRLPTEAEWEYAARAVSLPTGEGRGGAKVRFGNGKDIADPEEINFDGSAAYKQPYSKTGEYRKKTAPFGQFPPNALGLYDMSGNVWEWCEDLWHDDYLGAPDGGSAWVSGEGTSRVLRGGSWASYPRYCRAASRHDIGPTYRGDLIGFRVALAASFQ